MAGEVGEEKTGSASEGDRKVLKDGLLEGRSTGKALVFRSIQKEG